MTKNNWMQIYENSAVIYKNAYLQVFEKKKLSHSGTWVKIVFLNPRNTIFLSPQSYMMD